jgi:hypothetical protein
VGFSLGLSFTRSNSAHVCWGMAHRSYSQLDITASDIALEALKVAAERSLK